MKASPLFPALNGGELSPLLVARIDLAKFGIACRRLSNFLPLKEGPISRRPGLQHMGYAAHWASAGFPSWLARFVFGRRDAWLLEFAHETLRFWFRGGRVESSPGVAYELATPWPVAALANGDGAFGLALAQARDRMWIASPTTAPHLLERHGATDWSLEAFAPEDGPFDPENTDDTQALYVTGSTAVGATVTLEQAGAAAPFLRLHPLNGGTFGQLIRLFRAPGQAVRPWEAGVSVSKDDVRLSDGKYYKALNGGTTGGIRPIHTEGAAFDKSSSGIEWQYLHAGYGVVQVTARIAGDKYRCTVLEPLPDEVVGAANATYRWQINAWGAPLEAVAVDESTLTAINADTAKQVSLTLGGANVIGGPVTLDWQPSSAYFPFGGVGKITRLHFTGDYAGEFCDVLVDREGDFGELYGHLLSLVPGYGEPELFTPKTGWQHGDQIPTDRWPSAVGFAFSRLVFGRGNKLWFSRTDDFLSFADRSFGEILADDALTITLTGPEVTSIRWVLETAAGLLVGTDGGEYLVTKANNSEVFGSVTDATRNVEAKQHTAYGSAAIRPVLAHGKTLLVDATRTTIRETEKRIEMDRLAGLELSAMASHILAAGVRWQAWQGAPDNILWLGLDDGRLVSLTYLPEQEIVAFARHTIASIMGSSAYVEHGETLPSDDGKRSDLWLVVRRTFGDASVKRYIERMAAPWRHGTGLEPADSRHLDSFLAYQGAPATVISGLGHLRGEVVHGLADGFEVGPLTVEPDGFSGYVTLPNAASSVVLGLKYESEVALLVPDAGGREGPGTHKLRRARRAIATLAESGDAFQAGTLATLRTISERSAQLPLGEVPPLVSGDVVVPLDLGRAYRPDLRVAAESTLPFTLAAVMQRMEIAE